MKRNHLTAAISTVALVAIGIATWTLGSASGAAPNRVTTSCRFEGERHQRVQVDPIVNPGAPLSAHLHDFYGRIDISPTMYARPNSRPGFESDPGDISPSYDTCPTYGEWPAYWFPTPKFNDALILSGKLSNTWQSPVGSRVVAPPFGMTFVSGNSKATATDARVRFTCGNLDEPGSASPTDCTSAGGVVTAEITFPDCWDGTTAFDTPAGISPSHFSYSQGGACAPGAVMMAQLVTQQQFIDPRTNAAMVNPLNADGSLGLSFASGPYYTYHGDFLNTWNHILGRIVDDCLNQPPCGAKVHNVLIA